MIKEELKKISGKLDSGSLDTDFIVESFCKLSTVMRANPEEISDIFVGDKKSPYYIFASSFFESSIFKTTLFELMKSKDKIWLDFNNRNNIIIHGEDKGKILEFNQNKKRLSYEIKLTVRNRDRKKQQLLLLLLQLVFLPVTFTKFPEYSDLFKQFEAHIRNIEASNKQEFNTRRILEDIHEILFNRDNVCSWSFPPDTDWNQYVDDLKISRGCCGVSILNMYLLPMISNNFKYYSRQLAKRKAGLNDAGRAIIERIIEIKSFTTEYIKSDNTGCVAHFSTAWNLSSNSHITFLLESVLDGFVSSEDTNTACDKIMLSTTESYTKVFKYFKQNYKVFHSSEGTDGDWTNKLFIVSLRTLSVFMALAESRNDPWKYGVFRYEFALWFDEMHKILNHHDIIDDWSTIKKYLTQEGTSVEWKSSLYTSTEDIYVDDQTEKQNEKRILGLTIKPLLSMMNTDGGVIVVGVVEHPEKIKRDDVNRNTIRKNGHTFFNIDYELEKRGKDIDTVKREIQTRLENLTGLSAEKFNGLFTIASYSVKENSKECTILIIHVEKSDTLIYERETIGASVVYKLSKRADGRNVTVDLLEYLKQENNS